MALATQLDILLPDTEAHDAMHYWADSDDQARIDETVRSLYGLDALDWKALVSGSDTKASSIASAATLQSKLVVKQASQTRTAAA